jgi:hypothetical protein
LPMSIENKKRWWRSKEEALTRVISFVATTGVSNSQGDANPLVPRIKWGGNVKVYKTLLSVREKEELSKDRQRKKKSHTKWIKSYHEERGGRHVI